MISKVLFGISLAASIASLFLFISNMRLQENLAEVNAAYSAQKTTLSDIKSKISKSIEENSELQFRLQDAQTEISELRNVLVNHNLTKLAKEKPGLIETRINNATKKLFNDIERITAE